MIVSVIILQIPPVCIQPCVYSRLYPWVWVAFTNHTLTTGIVIANEIIIADIDIRNIWIVSFHPFPQKKNLNALDWMSKPTAPWWTTWSDSEPAYWLKYIIDLL